eukprot:gene3004-2486_t
MFTAGGRMRMHRAPAAAFAQWAARFAAFAMVTAQLPLRRNDRGIGTATRSWKPVSMTAELAGRLKKLKQQGIPLTQLMRAKARSGGSGSFYTTDPYVVELAGEWPWDADPRAAGCLWAV